MFDLYFYLMISYFFEFCDDLYKIKQNMLKKRNCPSYISIDEYILFTQNKKEQVKIYSASGFLTYLEEYVKYF